MKSKKKLFDIFNLSFLDIISCGFGAVVLLVLISNTAENQESTSLADVSQRVDQLMSLENSITTLTKEIATAQADQKKSLALGEKLKQTQQNMSATLVAESRKVESLDEDLKGLEFVQSSLKRVSITPDTSKTVRDEEVGGIPVDSDYVIFIVDTSGSMLSIWDRVSREILNVLSIHPEVKGFQILNDQGKSLISGYSERWIPDTPQRRKNVMGVFSKWRDASNSSPVEGIEAALKKYAKDGQSTAIYVFGDDYTGSSYDQTVSNITEFNRQKQNGTRLAKIHGVGFLSKFTTGRFAILMREIAKRNGGTFLALPL